jgi:hypothetical protein
MTPSFRGASQRVRPKLGPMTGSASDPGIQRHIPRTFLDSGFARSRAPE